MKQLLTVDDFNSSVDSSFSNFAAELVTETMAIVQFNTLNLVSTLSDQEGRKSF